MASVFDRYPERKARAEARAARQAKLVANERRLDELNVEIEDAKNEAPKTKIAALAAKLIAGGKVDPESVDGLREQRDKLIVENRVIREALEMDDRWLNEFDNTHCKEICQERWPERAELYHQYLAHRIEAARVATKIVNLHWRDAADDLKTHQVYLPKLVCGSNPYGYGKEDLREPESQICRLIRQAVEAGYVDAKDQMLIGVNWRRK